MPGAHTVRQRRDELLSTYLGSDCKLASDCATTSRTMNRSWVLADYLIPRCDFNINLHSKQLRIVLFALLESILLANTKQLPVQILLQAPLQFHNDKPTYTAFVNSARVDGDNKQQCTLLLRGSNAASAWGSVAPFRELVWYVTIVQHSRERWMLNTEKRKLKSPTDCKAPDGTLQ